MGLILKRRGRKDAILASRAAQARANAHAAYTGRRAGVALRLAGGRIAAGASFENAAYLHGFSALETALCRMFAEMPEEISSLPVIEEIHASLDAPPDYASGADHGGWGLAAQFAAPRMRVTLSWPGQKVVSCSWRRRLIPPFVVRPDCDVWPLPSSLKASSFADEAERNLLMVWRKAFAPVSRYRVGAMAESACGHVFYGCNVETGGNKSLHAEASALSAMVTALGPAARLRRMTILTQSGEAFPCGGCRQYMNELAMPETEIVLTNLGGERQSVRLRDLCPFFFSSDDLNSSATSAAR